MAEDDEAASGLDDYDYTDADVFDEDEAYRIELERRTELGARIEIDLQYKGPLLQYAKDRHEEAVAALRALVDVDPENPVEIIRLQSVIKAWQDIVRWTKYRLAEAAETDFQIAKEFGDGEEADTADEV